MVNLLEFLLYRLFGHKLSSSEAASVLKRQCKVGKTVDTRLETIPYNEWIWGIYEQLNPNLHVK